MVTLDESKSQEKIMQMEDQQNQSVLEKVETNKDTFLPAADRAARLFFVLIQVM